MFIEECYRALKQLRITKSHAQFSRAFLGKSERYLDYLICSQAVPSTSALVSLHFRMTTLAQAFAKDGQHQRAVIALQELSEHVWQELERRGMRGTYARRIRPMRGGDADRMAISSQHSRWP